MPLGPIKPVKPNSSLDVLRVARNMHPFEYERYILGSLISSQNINIVIINETKTKIELSQIQEKMSMVPQFSMKMGSVRLRYTLRLAKDANDHIGGTDIVITVQNDDRPQLYDADKPQPKTYEFKINVHIPNSLLNLVLRKALAFVEPLDIKLSETARRNREIGARLAQANFAHGTGLNPNNYGHSSNEYDAYRNLIDHGIMVNQSATRPVSDGSIPEFVFDPLEKHYNGIRGVDRSIIYGYHNSSAFGTSPIAMRSGLNNSLRKVINPHFRVTPQQINRQLDWITRAAKVGTGDADLLPIQSYGPLNKITKGVGYFGDGLTAFLLVAKFNKNTRTASMWADTVVLAAGIFAAIFSVPVLGYVCFAYGVVNYISDGYLSHLWDVVFPTSSPLPPLTYSSYVRF